MNRALKLQFTKNVNINDCHLVVTNELLVLFLFINLTNDLCGKHLCLVLKLAHCSCFIGQLTLGVHSVKKT